MRLINFICIFMIFILVCLSNASKDDIATVVGIGESVGFSGDGGLATSAQLSTPHGVYVDSSGDIYIADTDNSVIRKVGGDGVITTVAGTGASYGYSGDGGPATSAQLSYPYGVYVDSSGNMFIADTDNSVIRKVDGDGVITTVAGTGESYGYSGDGGPATSAQLSYPYGVYVDSSGNMYIADSYNNVIRKVVGDGVITTVAGIGRLFGYNGDGGPATSAKLRRPYGVYVDSSGNIFIADTVNHVIRKVGVDGVINTVAGTGRLFGYGGDGRPATSAKLSSPSGVYVDSSGDMFIADTDNHVIRKVGEDGVITTVAGIGGFSGDGGPATSATLSSPYGLYIDSSGYMYIADTLNHAIRKVGVDGVITTVAGIGGLFGYSGDGGPATSAQLSYPYGVYVDSSGDMFIADLGNHVIRKVDGDGVITTVAGIGRLSGFSGDGGPATSAQLSSPSGVYVDSSGDMIIADLGNHAIRKVGVDGVITTVAGIGRFPGYSGDSGPATSAKLSSPSGVYVDSSGDMIIADTDNSVIRKVGVDGVITTVAGIGRFPGYSGDSGPAASAQLSSPSGVYVDSSGNMYIADTLNHAIRKVGVDGVITTVAGIGGLFGFRGNGGLATSARLSYLRGVYVDSSGNMYIADSGNHVIRKVGGDGVITTAVGIGASYGFSGDGGLATSAQLSYPHGVYVDSSGDMFIADTYNCVIRKVGEYKPYFQSTRQPVFQPSKLPTTSPFMQPTTQPSSHPSSKPTCIPSRQPSCQPSARPSDAPITSRPTKNGETNHPTSRPTSSRPSSQPTRQPSRQPSCQPTRQPSSQPSYQPSIHPYRQPTLPSSQPTIQPFTKPSMQPTSQPSIHPRGWPSTQPSLFPSIQPSRSPTRQPITYPSNQPTSFPSNPSSQPSVHPSAQPSSSPTEFQNIWVIEVSRFDDFFDPSTVSDISSIDFDYFCINRNWRTIGPTTDCTLRLAIYYCLFRFPWNNDPNSRCIVLMPPLLTLDLNYDLKIFEERYQLHNAIRIVLDFQYSTIMLTKSQLNFGKGRHSIYLSIKSVLFNDHSADHHSVIEIINVRQLELHSTYFDRVKLSVTNTSLLYISNAIVFDNYNSISLSLTDNENVTITNSIFRDNSAGAISSIACGSVLIMSNVFFNNSAAFGSAIFLQRTSVLSVVSKNVFSLNKASYAGIIYWVYSTDMSAPMVTAENIWSNNSARYYGVRSATSFCGSQCFLVTPSSINFVDYTDISLPSAISVKVIDYYGSVISYHNERVTVSADKESSNCIGTLRDAPIGHDPFVVDKKSNANYMNFNLKEGEGHFSNLGVRCLPSAFMGIRLKALLSIPSFDASFDPSNLLLMFKAIPFYGTIYVTFRSCIRGEIFDVNSPTQSSCSKCSDGYSFDDNKVFNSVSLQCTPCPKEAQMCTGDQIILKHGFWRLDVMSTKIYPCQSISACVGGNSSSLCSIGHIGPLCGVCEPGFQLTSGKVCEPCSNIIDMIKSSGSILGLLVLFAVVYWKIDDATKDLLHDDYINAVFSKVVESYKVLLLGLGTTSGFQSFAFFSKFMGYFKIVNLDFSSIISPHCFFKYNYYNFLRFKLLFPIGTSALITFLGNMSSSVLIRNRYYSFLVSFLCFFIPIIASTSLEVFKCTDIETGSLLISDLSITCSGNEYENHKILAFFGVFCSIVLFPLCFFVVLFSKRKLIASSTTIESYRSIIKYASTLNIKLSSYYDAVLPFESLYVRYHTDVWWYDIYLIVSGLLLSSVSGALIDDERVVIMVSILVLLLSYVMQDYIKPYKYSLEDAFSYYSTFNLIIIFICTYTQATSGLGNKAQEKTKYDLLDLFLVGTNILYILMAVYFVYSHLKGKAYYEDNKMRDSEKISDINKDNDVLIDDDDITKYLKGKFEKSYKSSWEFEIPDSVSTNDLLTSMGSLFFLIAPRSVYNMMKKRHSFINDLLHIYNISIDDRNNNGFSLVSNFIVFPLHKGSRESTFRKILKSSKIKNYNKQLKLPLINNIFAEKHTNPIDFPVIGKETHFKFPSVGSMVFNDDFIRNENDNSIFKIEIDMADNDVISISNDMMETELNDNEKCESFDDGNTTNNSVGLNHKIHQSWTNSIDLERSDGNYNNECQSEGYDPIFRRFFRGTYTKYLRRRK